MSLVRATVSTGMTAVAWTAIGLLGTTLAVLTGAILQLGGRIDAHTRELSMQIHGLDEKLSSRIEVLDQRLSARIDAQSSRIDAQSSRIDAHLRRHAG